MLIMTKIAANLSSTLTKGQVPMHSPTPSLPHLVLPRALDRGNCVSPFHKWGTWGSKRLRNSTQVTQLERGRLEFKLGSGQHQGPAFSSTPHSCGSKKGFQCHISLGGQSQGQHAQSGAKGFCCVKHSSPRTRMAPFHAFFSSLLSSPLFHFPIISFKM